MKYNYFLDSLQAIRRRTWDWTDLDVEPPVKHKGMSWTKSISITFYYWYKNLTKTLNPMKKSGEGLHILWEIISKGIEYRWEQFKDWAFSPNEDNLK